MTAIIAFVASLAFTGDPDNGSLELSPEVLRGPPDVVLDSLDFDIPFRINERFRSEISKIQLFMSSDYGKSWRRAQSKKVEDVKGGTFTFHAPKDGEYWFTLQTIKKDGTKEDEPGLMKVGVRTNSKIVTVESKNTGVKDQLAEFASKLSDAEARIARLENEKKQRTQEYDAQIAELRARLANVERRLAALEGNAKKKKK
jgi:hypothetical protein